jgi:hypothetical protein
VEKPQWIPAFAGMTDCGKSEERHIEYELLSPSSGMEEGESFGDGSRTAI